MNRNIIATILIVLAIGTYFTVTKKIMIEVDEVRKVNAEYDSAIESAKRLISVRDQVLRDYNNLSAVDRDRLSRMVPGSIDNIRLMLQVKDVAMTHGFTLDDLRAETSAKSSDTNTSMPTRNPDGSTSQYSIATPTMDTVTVSFLASAPYLEFIGFLQDLEANLRIMDVSKLSMKSSEDGVYDFTVELKTYWLRQQ
ncbi:MAG: hypothetical protein WC648_02600 [Candidatus Paceibacterota bacterium]|jgi:hypothetical protein